MLIVILTFTAANAAAAAAAQAAQAAAAAAAAAAAQKPPVASGSNAAILSLLNTSPVNNVNSATSAAVANAITNTSTPLTGPLSAVNLPTNNQSLVNLPTNNLQVNLQQQNQKILGRKMTIANVPRVLNNVITVNNNNANVPQQVRISALASQLASPPVNVIIATANTSQQQQQFTLTTVSGTGFPTHVSYTTVPLNNTKTPQRIVSNVRKTSENNIALSRLLVNTPAADHPIPGSNNASALLERLSASSSASATSEQLVNSKTMQIPVQLNKSNQVIAPLSSPQGQQTLNLHTLNLTPFQGTINNIPGIQNVQVSFSLCVIV